MTHNKRALSTQDFQTAGLPFEMFLRFSQFDTTTQARATTMFWRDYGYTLALAHEAAIARTINTLRRIA